MGKKSGPDNSGLNQAALDSTALSKESLDWFKQEYAATAPDRADATARANAVSDAQLAGMEFATQAARDADTRNKTVFQPLEDKIVADAQAYDTEGRRMQAANEARASVETAYGNAQDGLNRTLQRQGVTPGSGRSLALMQDANLGKVKAITGATSDAVKNVEAQGYARMQDAAALGKGVVGNQATQQQIATQAGTAATGAAGAGLSHGHGPAGAVDVGVQCLLRGQQRGAALGLKPIDGVYVAALAARTGLDFTNSSFSVAAIALPTILITELLGAALVSIALARTGESVRPWRQSGSRTAAELADTQRAYAVFDIKEMDEEKREIEGYATTPEPDRMGDVVELRPYEGKALKNGAVIAEFKVKSDVIFDEVRAGGRIHEGEDVEWDEVLAVVEGCGDHDW